MDAFIETLRNIDAGDWFVLVGSLATITLAITAVIQGRRIASQDTKIDEQATRIERQIEVSERQVAMAEEGAKTTAASLEMARRSHIDEGAPDVFVTLEAPNGPQIDPQRTSMPGADELRLLQPASLVRSVAPKEWEFHLDTNRESFLWFYGRGLVRNDGRTTARVRISPEARFIAGDSPVDPTKSLSSPQIEDPGPNPVAILPPGGQALFEWAAGHSLGEWASAHQNWGTRDPGGSIWLWIVTFDTRELGVIDTQMVHLRPEPIRPVPNKSGHWELVSTPPTSIAPLPKRRNYRHDGWDHEDTSQMREYHDQASPE